MIDAQTDSELREWQDLVQSPGWKRLVSLAKKEWGDGYGLKCKLAVKKALAEGTDVEAAIKEVDAANDALNVFMSYPDDRVGQLRKAREDEKNRPAFFSRRRA